MRRSGLGASEISAVVEREIPHVVGIDEAGVAIVSGTRTMPVSPYEDGNEVYWRKVPPFLETADFTTAMMAGTFLETGVIDWYCYDQGVKVHRSRTRRHPRHRWMLATRDRVVMDGGKPVRNVEAKVAMDYRPRKGAPVGLKDEYERWYSWGDDPEAVPQHYRLQIEQQMEATGVHECDLVVFFCLRRELKIYRLRRNPALSASIIDAGHEFWHKYVKRQQEPPKRWIEGDSVMDWLQLRYAEYEDTKLEMATEEVEEWARRYDKARSDESNAKKLKEAAKAELCTRIGLAAAAGFAGGWGECTWRTEPGRIAYKELAEDLMVKHVAEGLRPLTLEVFRAPEQRVFGCKVR